LLPAAEDEDEGALLDEAFCCGAADAGSATVMTTILPSGFPIITPFARCLAFSTVE
jgi:hypothetical protein